MKRLLLLALLLLPGTALATDFYTSSTGIDTGANTCLVISNPCNLANGIAYELGKIGPSNGDFLYMCADACNGSGSYSNTSLGFQTAPFGSLNFPSGSSWANAFTLKAYPGETITTGAIYYAGVSYFIIDGTGWDIDGTAKVNGQITAIDGGGATTDHIRIENMVIHDTEGDCIGSGGGMSYIELLDNTVGPCGTMLSTTGFQIHGVYFTNITNILIDGGSYFGEHFGSSIHAFDQSGPNPVNCTIRNITMYDSNASIITNCSGASIYNTVTRDMRYTETSGGANGITIWSPATSVSVFNNTVVGPIQHCIWELSNLHVTTIRNNICSGSDGAFEGNFVTNETNLDNMSLSYFTSAATDDYTLTSDSPALDTGTDSTTCGPSGVVTTDKNGQNRPQGLHCDIGAYETPTGVIVSNPSPNMRTSRVTDTFGSASGDIGSPYTQVFSSPKCRYDGSGNAITLVSDFNGCIIRQTTATFSTTKIYVETVYGGDDSSTDGSAFGGPGCFDASGNGYATYFYDYLGTKYFQVARYDAGVIATPTLGNVTGITAPIAGTTRLGLECNFTTHQFWGMLDDEVLISATDSTYSSSMKPAVLIAGGLKIASADFGDINFVAANGVLTMTGPLTSTCVSGSACSISWTSSNITGTVNLYYLVGGNQYLIASPAYDASPYSWMVNAPASAVAQLRVSQGAVTDDGSTFTIYGTKSHFR